MPKERFTRIAMAAVLLLLAALPAFALPSNKWRIQCSEGAKSTGEILFRFTPKGGTPFDVKVGIPKGTGENAVARLIRDTFRRTLDAKRFHVEVDDGEDVLVKKKGGAPDFDLEVVANTVKALRINLDRE
jgi:hypothetical protein